MSGSARCHIVFKTQHTLNLALTLSIIIRDNPGVNIHLPGHIWAHNLSLRCMRISHLPRLWPGRHECLIRQSPKATQRTNHWASLTRTSMITDKSPMFIRTYMHPHIHTCIFTYMQTHQLNEYFSLNLSNSGLGVSSMWIEYMRQIFIK